jgi:hypothetical protein
MMRSEKKACMALLVLRRRGLMVRMIAEAE